MQFLRVVFMAAMAAIAVPQHLSGPDVVAVQGVVDGNTVVLATYGHVRLAGIHAPRIARRGFDGEPFAREASARLEGLVGRRFVRLEFPSATSRASAWVVLDDGTFVNALLVAEGLARVSGRPGGPRGEELARAQARAQQARVGIWSGRP
ncbi:MAG TPA: thermonuclease family protein [Vicinamibacterales bacterium]|jgi:micrococcal nuclease